MVQPGMHLGLVDLLSRRWTAGQRARLSVSPRVGDGSWCRQLRQELGLALGISGAHLGACGKQSVELAREGTSHTTEDPPEKAPPRRPSPPRFAAECALRLSNLLNDLALRRSEGRLVVGP